MFRLLCAVLLLGAASAEVPQRKSYFGYQLLRITPTAVEQVKFLNNLMHTDEHLDFWVEPSGVGKAVEVMVPPRQFRRLQVRLRKEGIDFEKIVDNVASLLEPMWKEYDARKNAKGGMVFDIEDYNTLEDIYAWMEDSIANCRAGFVCNVYNVGDSYEGRPINVFHIAAENPGPDRKAYWIDSAIHAREWIAPATNLKVLDNLIRGGDANAIRLTDAYDWYIMPIMNPDGYAFSHVEDRLWRKNRRPNPGSVGCVGTDLNRNFDFRWGHEGVSHVPCGQTYCGPNGGSEPETQAVQSELDRLASVLLAMVTIHSYGNMWMFPWGNTIDYAGVTCERADDHADMMSVSVLTANAIESAYGTRWDRGTSCEVIYETTGGTDDYAKGVSGIKYAFCPELRGNSFILPSSNITPSFNEFWRGIVTMVDAIAAIEG